MASPDLLLVVDDSEAEREIMALTLGAAFPDAKIRLAAHTLLAAQMCKTQGFDCVLTDYNMPDMDGVTVASELRAEAAYLPIVLMTSVGDEMLAAEALRRGISDYIPKSRITTESIRRRARDLAGGGGHDGRRHRWRPRPADRAPALTCASATSSRPPSCSAPPRRRCWPP